MTIKSGGGVALACVAFVVFCAGVVTMAVWLIRSNRAAVISTLPLLREQSVAIETPAELIVSVEVPRLATDYQKWEFEVVEKNTGRVHAMKYRGPRSTGTVATFSTLKIPLGRITLDQPGTLALRVNGLAADADYSAYHLILTHPYLLRMALQIVGLVLCGVGMLLSVIWGCWLLGLMKTA